MNLKSVNMKNKSLLLATMLLLAILPSIAQAQWTGTTDIYNTNSGNVGIGTSSPAAKLHVNGTTFISGATTIDNNLTMTGTSLIIGHATQAGQVVMSLRQSSNASSGWNIGYTSYNNNDFYMYGFENSAYRLYTNGAERLTVTGSGDVGIGTSTPSTKLEVNGSTKIVTGNTGNFSVASYAGGNHLYFDGSSGLTSLYMLKAGNIQTQTSGQTQIRGEVHPQLLFVNGSYIAGYQSPILIKRTWPGVGSATLVLDDEGGVTASTYKILQAKFNGTEMAYIKGDGGGYFEGNVGIGTTTPVSKLDVAGTISATSSITLRSENGQGIYGALSIINPDGWRISQQNTNYAIVGQNGNWFKKGIHISDYEYAFNGEVITGPSTTETVMLSLKRNVSNEAPNIMLSGSWGEGGYPASPALYFADARRAFAAVKAIQTSGGGTTNAGGVLTFATSPGVSSTPLTERMRIDENGNVGIGTSSPTANLHVNGTFKFTDNNQGAGKVLTSDANGLASWQTPSSGSSSQWTTTGSDIYYNTGKVGIGTTAPTAQLEVAGSNPSVLVNTTGNVAAQIMVGTGTHHFGLQYYPEGNCCWPAGTNMITTGSSPGNLMFYTMNPIQFYIGGEERMRLTATGNVGIGTATPATKLDVAGDATFSGYVNAAKTFTTSPTSSSGLVNGSITVNGSGTNAAGIAGVNGLLSFKGNNTYTSSNSSAGLIGTVSISAGANYTYTYGHELAAILANPIVDNLGGSASADRLNGIRVTPKIYNGANVGWFTGLKIDAPDLSGGGTVTSLHSIYVASNAGNAYFGDKVGIGVAAPQGRLETPEFRFTTTAGNNPVIQGLSNGMVLEAVQNGTQLQLRTHDGYTAVYGGNTDGEIRLVTAGGTERLRLKANGGISVYDAQPMTFSTNNTERLRIEANGGVAIGTVTNPSVFDTYKLAVAGNIIAEKVRVKLQSSTWPDYVFNYNYKLPTLKEIEEYIQQHQHLPGVPSAATIEKEGLDLGDGQAILLQKIEELTLHMIEMNKRMEKLEKENASMKKQLEKN